MIEARVGIVRAHVLLWVMAATFGPAGCSCNGFRHLEGLEVEQSDGTILPAEMV